MAGLFQRANLAISRAGAATLTELTVTQTPAILIPYPYAAEDHQIFNAAVLADAGAGIVFRESELTPQLLESKVLHFLKSPLELEEMRSRAGALAIPDSAEILANLIRKLVEA